MTLCIQPRYCQRLQFLHFPWRWQSLALVLWRSREPGLRKVARVSLPTQVFQINEPTFFGLPVVLNPVLMVPYILNALLLTAGTYVLMSAGIIARPVINIPWTTPQIGRAHV